MKLWLLRPVENLPTHDDPWGAGFDKAYGFVVRADNEADARRFAHSEGGDENKEVSGPWLSAQFSTCAELTADGKPGIILQDFNAG